MQIDIEEYEKKNKQEKLRNVFYIIAFLIVILLMLYFSFTMPKAFEAFVMPVIAIIFGILIIAGVMGFVLQFLIGIISKINAAFSGIFGRREVNVNNNGDLHGGTGKKGVSRESIIRSAIDKLKNEYLEVENNNSLSQEQKVSRVINYTSGLCATIAIQPIPFADFFILTPVQAYMGTRIAAIYNIDIKEQKINELLKQIGSTVGLGLMAQQLVIGAYKTVIPFMGAVTTIPLVYGMTYGIGSIMDAYFKAKSEKRSISEQYIKQIWKDALKEGREQGELQEERIKKASLNNYNDENGIESEVDKSNGGSVVKNPALAYIIEKSEISETYFYELNGYMQNLAIKSAKKFYSELQDISLAKHDTPFQNLIHFYSDFNSIIFLVGKAFPYNKDISSVLIDAFHYENYGQPNMDTYDGCLPDFLMRPTDCYFGAILNRAGSNNKEKLFSPASGVHILACRSIGIDVFDIGQANIVLEKFSTIFDDLGDIIRNKEIISKL